MKTIKKFFLSFFAIALVSILLSSCFSATTTSIEIKQMPSTTFEVGTTEVEKLMIVKVTDNGVTNEVVLSIRDGQVVSSIESFNLVLEGFDLTTPGSRTAAVKYGELVSYFDYQVLAETNLFAGGDGSSKNPYQLATAEHIININKVTTTGKYFKLMNDIDMAPVTNPENLSLDAKYPEYFIAYIKSFYGTLDGNGKKLYNIDDTSNNTSGRMLFLFGKLYGGTVRNLDVYINSEGGICLAANVYSKVLFENVDVYGTCIGTGHNYGTYVTYAWNSRVDIKFVDCDNYVDIIDSDALYVAAFVAYPLGAKMSFENSFYYGYMEALQTAVFVCNGSQKGTLKYVNSGNKGTLSSVKELSDVCVAVAQSNISIDSTSTGLSEGTVKQIPTFAFKANTKIVDGKLVINKVAADSEVVKVAVTMSFRWMREATGSTNTAYQSSSFAIGSEADVETQLFLTSLVDGVPTIKITYAADYVKGEGETEVTFEGCAWLKYNVEQGTYVFDGSMIQEGQNYVTYGNPAITILAYDANDEVVSATIVDVTVAK